MKNDRSMKWSYNTIIEDVGQNLNSSLIEEYRVIRTKLMFALPKIECKKIIITSSVPKEGKTASAINLAITLALAENRVLIIDCDVHKPFIHEFLKLKSTPGLSDVLMGMTGISGVIQETKYPSLKVVSAGKIPLNHAELLGSAAMADLLKSLEIKFDYILLDTPPINEFADALILTKITDGVIMIALQGETTHPQFSKALSSLEFASANVLGVIINNVKRTGGYDKD